jgi:predicted DNA-binding transcriptional regulator
MKMLEFPFEVIVCADSEISLQKETIFIYTLLLFKFKKLKCQD